jgi:FAD:protein FMN transferase
MEHPRDSIRRARPLLGTFVEICASGASAEDLETAVEAAFGAIAKVQRLMSFHESGSDVSRLNRDASTTAVKVDPWTFHVLEAALELHRRSDGAFDITTATTLQRLGVLPDLSILPDRNCSMAENHAPCRSAAQIELLPNCQVRFHSGDTLIDLGGIAKGFAADRAIDALRERCIPSALVNAGGDVVAFGARSYPIHIRDPRDPTQVLCEIELQNEALATSSARFDPFRSGRAGTPEIIDPKTERPATSIAGATVLAPTCMIADALTKVVMIACEAAGALLEHYDANALMISGDGSVCFTSGLRGALNRAA